MESTGARRKRILFRRRGGDPCPCRPPPGAGRRSRHTAIRGADRLLARLQNPHRVPGHRFRTDRLDPQCRVRAAAGERAAFVHHRRAERYVADDQRVIGDFRPDAVVGDFRLSLSVSARIARVPYLTITNAYWSPYARPHFPVPALPITRLLGVRAAQAVFDLIRPLAFARHALPLNRVRRRHGLPGLGWGLLRTYTDADYTLYADLPDLIPVAGAPPTHRYLGPILWSFPAPLPAWWQDLPTDRPVIYVTLGSSGDANLLSLVVRALANTHFAVVATTAGRVTIADPPRNCHLADFLPGAAASARGRAGNLQWRQPDCLPGPGGWSARPRAREQHGPTDEHGIRRGGRRRKASARRRGDSEAPHDRRGRSDHGGHRHGGRTAAGTPDPPLRPRARAGGTPRSTLKPHHHDSMTRKGVRGPLFRSERCLDQAVRRRRAVPPRAANPSPRSARVPGSGTNVNGEL